MAKGTMYVRPRHGKMSTYVRSRLGDKPGGQGSRTMLTAKPRKKVNAKKHTKTAHSFTTTTTKTKNKKVTNLNAGAESNSYTSYIKKLAKSNKPWKTLSNRQIMHREIFQAAICTPGTQNHLLLGIPMEGYGSDDSIAGLLRDQSLLLTTATDLFGTAATGTAGYRQVRLLYEGVKQTTKIQNQGQGTTDMWIYDLVSKVTKESYSAPDTDWADGYVDTNVLPAAAIATYGGGNTTIGAIPTESKVFNINWKVLKVTTVRLGPGAEHNHIFNMRPNKVIDGTYAANFQQIKGVTTGILLIHRGPLVDSTSGNAAAGTITYGHSKLITANDIKICSRIVGQYPAHTTWVGSAPSTAPANEFLETTAINVVNIAGAVAPVAAGPA